MKHSLWVSMSIIRNIIMFSGKTTHAIATICKMGNIEPEDLEKPDFKLSLEQNCAIMEAALTISGDEYLGLHIGEKTTSSVLGITGHLMESSKNVLIALQNIQQFTRAFTQLYDFRVDIQGKKVYYYCEPVEIWNDISPDTARHSVDITFAGVLHILRLLTGQSFQPLKVLYRYTRIPNLAEHERILRCRPLFNQKSSCIVFSLEDVSFPIVGYNKELNDILKNILEKELREKVDQASFTEQARQIILKNYQFVFPQLEDIAAIMHLTPRSFQRKLQEENTSFRSLADSIKMEIACNLLSNSSISVEEIAYKLGYANRSSFQRAFLKWTGKTPGDYQIKN